MRGVSAHELNVRPLIGGDFLPRMLQHRIALAIIDNLSARSDCLLEEQEILPWAAPNINNSVARFEIERRYSLPTPPRYVEAEPGKYIEPPYSQINLRCSLLITLDKISSATIRIIYQGRIPFCRPTS